MTDQPALLSAAETDALADCERVIERGIQVFADVGRALMRIRDERLYRRDFTSFEDYCRERWRFEKSHTYRLIHAARVSVALDEDRDSSPTGDSLRPSRPSSERQARPLTKLLPKRDDPPEQRERAEQQVRDTWDRAVDSAPAGKLTAEHVQRIVEEEIAAARETWSRRPTFFSGV